MADQSLDKNETALTQYFLRGMRRFAKHVRAQDVFENAHTEAIQAHIETAYRLACAQFAVREDQ